MTATHVGTPVGTFPPRLVIGDLGLVAWYVIAMRNVAAVLALLALGCGARLGECGDSPFPDGYCEPFEPSGAAQDIVSLKCSYVPFFCCDTCGDNEYCLDFCIDEEQ